MSHGDSSSSLSDERQKGAGGVLAWLSVPIDYFLSFFPAPSEAKTRPTASSAHWPGEEGGAGPSRRLFESASQFRDRFEEQFLLLAASAGLPAEGASAEHSVHGIYVPPNVEDWTAFAASLPDTAYPRYKMILPKKTKILALDLDETLVHSTSKSSSECDFFVEVFVDRSSCLYYVFKRPYVDHFLDTVSSWYHLVIYTASLKEYADPVVNWLDRGRGLFKKRLFRTACVEKMGVFVKNMSLVDADLSRVCLLDNSPASFLIHPENGIPIESWTHDRSDTSLLDLLPFLDALRFTEDVRCVLSLRRIQTSFA